MNADRNRVTTIPPTYLLLSFCFVLSGFIFVIDLLTPIGVADGTLYVAVVLVGYWLPYSYAPFLLAGICSVLVMFGLFLSPGGGVVLMAAGPLWIALANRTVSLLIIWMTAVLLHKQRMGQESRLKLAAIVESSDDAIIGQTVDGRITTWNRGAEDMFGYSAEETIGQSVTILFPPDRLSEEPNILERLSRGERIKNFETVRRRKDGRDINISLTISPMRNSRGEVIGAAKVARDITSQKQAETRLASQALEMAQYNKELASSNESLERFAYVASHDLQEPLRTVHSFAQLLASRYEEKLDTDAREFIQFITDGAKRMQELIHDLLAYSRVDTQGKPFASVSLSEVVRRILDDLKTTIEERNVSVRYDTLPTIQGDPTQVGQLFQNLISNAIKFQKDHPPEIDISVVEQDQEWAFSVRDNGIGIDSQYHDKIFTAFKRLHTLEEYSGTGMGLAICKKIIDRHEGKIWVTSQLGQGSTFHFSIPKPKVENLVETHG